MIGNVARRAVIECAEETVKHLYPIVSLQCKEHHSARELATDRTLKRTNTDYSITYRPCSYGPKFFIKADFLEKERIRVSNLRDLKRWAEKAKETNPDIWFLANMTTITQGHFYVAKSLGYNGTVHFTLDLWRYFSEYRKRNPESKRGIATLFKEDE